MTIKCTSCHKTVWSSSDTTNLFAKPWYQDEQGVNHQIWVCKSCGTVHDMIGASIWGALKGKPMECFRSLDTNGIKLAQHNSCLVELGLPAEVLSFLVEKNFISSS